MHDVFAENGPVKLFIHDDGETPLDFVRHVLHVVFGKSEQESVALATRIEDQSGIACGPFPAPVARALLESARDLIRSNGHPLLITTEAAAAVRPCDLCDAPKS